MPDSPLILAGTGARAPAWRSMTIATTALQHAAGGRTNVILRIGDARGADEMMRIAAVRLGWPQPRVFEAHWPSCGPECDPNDGHRRRNKYTAGTRCHRAGNRRNTAIVETKPKAHRGIALFAAAYRNLGTLDCSTKMIRAGIPVTVWCDACGPVPLTSPCEQHSLAEVLGYWAGRTEGLLPIQVSADMRPT